MYQTLCVQFFPNYQMDWPQIFSDRWLVNLCRWLLKKFCLMSIFLKFWPSYGSLYASLTNVRLWGCLCRTDTSSLSFLIYASITKHLNASTPVHVQLSVCIFTASIDSPSQVVNLQKQRVTENMENYLKRKEERLNAQKHKQPDEKKLKTSW